MKKPKRAGLCDYEITFPCSTKCKHFACDFLRLEADWDSFVRELQKVVEPIVVPLLDRLTKFLRRFDWKSRKKESIDAAIRAHFETEPEAARRSP